MQPDEKRKTKRQTGISRARVMLKKHVGWLPGYPIEMRDDCVRWQSVDWDGSGFAQSWILTGQELRQAQMTITKLRHHFPKALPEIVDDVDDWFMRMDSILDFLKSAIHDGQVSTRGQTLSVQNLPSRWITQFNESRQRHPRLTPLFNAIYYLELSKRRNANIGLIEWVDQRADALENLDSISHTENVVPLQLRFCALRKSSTDRLFESLVQAYADPMIHDCPIKHGFAHIQWLQQAISKRINGSKCKPEPKHDSQTVIQQLDPLLIKIRQEKPKRQKILLALLDLLICKQTLDDIHELKTRIDCCDRRLTRYYRQLEFGSQQVPTNRYERKELLAKLASDQVDGDDRETIVEHLAACLRVLPKLDNAEAEKWTRFLRLIPADHRALRLGLLSHWSQRLLPGNAMQTTAFYRVLSFFESLLRRRGVAEPILGWWNETVKSSHSQGQDWIVPLCVYHADDNRIIDRTLRLFESVIYDYEAKPGHYLRSTLVEFVTATDDIGQAVDVIAILAGKEDTYYSLDELRPAFEFGADPDEIVAILTAFDKMDDDTMETAAEALVSQAQDPLLRPAIVGRILAEDQKALKRMASIHQLLIALGGRPNQPDLQSGEAQDWMSVYPTILQTELQRLSEQSARAETIAGEILGKDFPDPKRLQKEIGVLSAKLDAGDADMESARHSHLKRRVANLQDRLGKPVTVSPARMDTLVKKLRVRIEHETVEQFVQSCRSGVAALISDRYQMDHVPEELLTPPLDAVLADMVSLSQPMRELGLRLIFETLNRSTRRFDTEPANEVFRSGLVNKGIKMDVWVGDTFETRAQTADGVPYRLRFTRDVMDFLLMGFHFGTCLSPGNCNFFSTVANAVDINKRVVYGKTEAGKIIGRCLFALNSDGQILTYHRYAHEAADKFDEAIDQFATELAKAMNSRLTNQGTVGNLVAQEWYDDGALGADNSETINDAIHQLMEDAKPDVLYAELQAIISRDEICSRIDELVAFKEIENRPEALRELLSGLAQDDALTRSQRFVVSRVTFRCADTAVAMEILAQIPPKQIIGIIKQTRCDYCSIFHGIGSYDDIFEMMIEFNPSIAVRMMRASRDARSRDDLSDQNPIRRKALAKAHRILGRTHLAEQLAKTKA